MSDASLTAREAKLREVERDLVTDSEGQLVSEETFFERLEEWYSIGVERNTERAEYDFYYTDDVEAPTPIHIGRVLYFITTETHPDTHYTQEE